MLAAHGISATVADARFAKPLDIDLIAQLAARPRGADHRSRKARSAASAPSSRSSWPRTACSTRGLRFRSMVLPDVFLDQDKPELLYAQGGSRRQGHRRQGLPGARQARGDVQDGVTATRRRRYRPGGARLVRQSRQSPRGDRGRAGHARRPRRRQAIRAGGRVRRNWPPARPIPGFRAAASSLLRRWTPSPSTLPASRRSTSAPRPAASPMSC